MRARQTLSCMPLASLPAVWLVSDARNDSGLERALRRLPRGSGLIFRHYHLPPAQRRERFRILAALARRREHFVILAGGTRQARLWGADGAYAAPSALGPAISGLRIATAHSLRELAAARRARADAVLLSPAFPTRSHPGARALGAARFLLLARQAALPAIALGGMDRRRAQALHWPRWAAIDGLARG